MTSGKTLFILLLATLAGTALAAAPRENPECEPNPVFSRFPGEVMTSCERARFKSLELWVRPTPETSEKPMSVEGEYWYYFNELTPDAKNLYPGKLEVQRNFENAVRAAKGAVLNSTSSKVVYKIRKGDDEFWGEAGCGRGSDDCEAVMHKVVRVAAMQQSVVVSAEQIARSIADEGKAVFYGLYFDTDKAVLKPESAPTLAEMAKWLKANPTKAVFIVGHTDMQGAVPHNLQLSKARGAAVVEALVKQHGIKAERLAGEGVGPFAPMSNNTSDAGRGKNRRVEMVLR